MQSPCRPNDDFIYLDTNPGKWHAANPAETWTPKTTESGSPSDNSGFSWRGIADPSIKMGDADFLNVLDFQREGATDSARIQCALDAARISGIGAVYLPRGTYTLNTGLRIVMTKAPFKLNQVLRLFSDYAVLKAGAGVPVNASEMIYLESNGARIMLENLVLDAGCAFKHCIRTFNFTGRASRLTNVRVGFAKEDGIYLERSQTSSFRGCSSEYNGKNGWTMKGCTALSLIGCQARRNAMHGFENFAEYYFTGGNFMAHVVSEGNDGSGIWAWDGEDFEFEDQHGSGLRVRDGIIADNGSHGVRIAARNMSVSGLTFIPRKSTEARWAWIESPSTGVVIRDCTVGRSVTAPEFHRAHDEAGRKRHVTFERNYATAAEAFVVGNGVASVDPERVAELRPELDS